MTSQTPPTFLAHAGNDPVNAENSIFYYLALKHAGVPAELHIYSTGGHGFGMRPSAEPGLDLAPALRGMAPDPEDPPGRPEELMVPASISATDVPALSTAMIPARRPSR